MPQTHASNVELVLTISIGLRIDQGLSSNVAWRVAFIVPFILIVSTAIGMFLLCDDTPSGKWSERHAAREQRLETLAISEIHDGVAPGSHTGSSTPSVGDQEKMGSEKGGVVDTGTGGQLQVSHGQMIEIARGEVVAAPTLKHSLQVLISPQTLFHAATYACSFGGELAINS